MDESNRNTLTGLAAPDGRIKLHASVRHSARSARIGFCFMAEPAPPLRAE